MAALLAALRPRTEQEHLLAIILAVIAVGGLAALALGVIA